MFSNCGDIPIEDPKIKDANDIDNALDNFFPIAPPETLISSSSKISLLSLLSISKSFSNNFSSPNTFFQRFFY